jgi:hypothetical protein
VVNSAHEVFKKEML